MNAWRRGLAGIYCARASGAAVTAVDVDPDVFPFVQLHARLNGVDVASKVASFEEVPHDLLAGQDVLIGADVCFREDMVLPLFGLVARALDAGVRRVVISDPGRLAFHNLAARCLEKLAGRLVMWQVEEPLLPWPGEPPRLEGRILALGPGWPAVD